VLPDVYTGPGARALGGVDIGWLVGLAVSGVTYWLLARSLRLSAEAGAVRDSDRELGRLESNRACYSRPTTRLPSPLN